MKLELTVKDGVDVAYPVVKLWIDKENHNILKRQEFALSGRLMRTAYYPKWQKLYLGVEEVRGVVPRRDALLRRGGEVATRPWC